MAVIGDTSGVYAKRDVALERSLEADLDRSASASGFAAWLVADQTSPSAGPSATKSCSAWPKHSPTFLTLMREVVVLKHCQGVDATADLRADRPHRLVCRFPLVQEAGKACGNE